MVISIIIIVKNDRGIENTLRALSSVKKVEDAEIIVVDASEGELNDIKTKFKKIKWYEFKSISTKKVTIPEQRNFGISKATGDIIVFIDANCIPDKNWLIELTDQIENGEEFIIAGSIWSFGDNKLHDLRNKLLDNKVYLEEAPTMSLAVHKEVFKSTGNFDETFDYGSDVDFIIRAIRKGYKVKYNKDAILYHDWGDLSAGFKRALKYGEARVNIYLKHKDRLKNLLSKDIVTLIYPLYILILPLVVIKPLIILLILIPLVKNIKSYPLQTTLFNLVYGFGVIKKLSNKLINNFII